MLEKCLENALHYASLATVISAPYLPLSCMAVACGHVSVGKRRLPKDFDKNK